MTYLKSTNKETLKMESVTNDQVTALASKLYSEIYPRSNFYNLQSDTPSYKGFMNIAKNILEGQYK